ncbi:hypothetical protein K7X08_014342 [Anisodus acutangulus]|uniref:Uncharacterized protein n=1 Tax=Anisodus acutangulus TaxID=402998 RepID=A0A9Q1LIA0_9SOLA|nr:hypothetical protein K7X08_014342 [Anisodus acutangulus]
MPDLRYYSSFKLEDSPEPGCSYTLDRAPSSNNLYVGISKSNEQKSLDIQTEEGYNSDSKVTIFLDVNENLDDFGGLKTGANSSSVENIIEGTSSVVPKLDKSIPIPLPDMVFQNSTSGTAGLSAAKGSEEDAVNTDKKGFYASGLNKIHLQIQDCILLEEAKSRKDGRRSGEDGDSGACLGSNECLDAKRSNQMGRNHKIFTSTKHTAAPIDEDSEELAQTCIDMAIFFAISCKFVSISYILCNFE